LIAINCATLSQRRPLRRIAGMLTRRLRRVVALVAIAGLAFAQVAAASAACVAGGSLRPQAAATTTTTSTTPSTTTPVHGEHCRGAVDATPAVPAGNACEVHCSDGAGPATALDLPAPALTMLAVPLVPLAARVDAGAPRNVHAVAVAGAPPPQLLYARFLI
jgi:hypothetical protein